MDDYTKAKVETGHTGCMTCKNYEYISAWDLDGNELSNCGGYGCSLEIEHERNFKTFPCKRKLYCWESPYKRN